MKTGVALRTPESVRAISPKAEKPSNMLGRSRINRMRRELRRSAPLYIILSIPFLFLLVFNYAPLFGAQIAFRNYNPVQGIWGSPWVGLQQFRQWVDNPDFWPVMRNTIVLSAYSIGVGTPATVILALMLNEVRHQKFKRF